MINIDILSGVRETSPNEWNSLVQDESPFLEWEWLASLEDSITISPEQGWSSRPLVAREDGRIVAACPLYVKGHSEGEFVFDWSWADAAHKAGIQYYPKLLVGIPFTPVAGARFLTAPEIDRPSWILRLSDALIQICKDNSLSGVHVNFCRKDELEALKDSSYLPRLSFQYHWKNEGFATFEDYLSSLRSKRRNQVRREQRAVINAGVEIQVFEGEEIPEDLFPLMYKIYLSTIDKNPWGRRYLNQDFFNLIGERFRSRLCFIIARRQKEIIAGTFNVIKGATLYGRYWGCFEDIRHLHFDVCYYAAIKYCIERGLSNFQPGAGGHYKQLRGFDPQITHSLHWLANPRLSEGVKRALEHEEAEANQAIDWYQEHTARNRATALPRKTSISIPD